ncbi:esterase/lipase family protein [Labedaea rhizosphaerae]|uniref:Triacylglycerol esterase/lipase EstA (Alpha/beta hydrolase family) n=1 Tax=Labedaea rhizosphaerae TaxID=598644 RepID=A0A4R6S208_LABRH|nr:alpha/beta fold hydrolase [Labedaea rhizosphaerae]TDP93629.1 triacylglycerol esterase/lipase EstA (alpha/beta hydrolase family) [Labedaea rhizosphaerae]
MRVRRWLKAATATAVAVTTLAVAAPSAQAATYTVRHNLAEGIAAMLPDPSKAPPGVNVDCHPSAAHPRPIVLVNGTFSNMMDDWAGMGPTLANAGYCVYGFNFGGGSHDLIQSIGPVRDAVSALNSRVNEVLAATGAAKVDLVGHSQGGLIAEFYTKFYGYNKVANLVGLSPTTHGTSLDGFVNLAQFFPGALDLVNTLCAACYDQTPGSSVIHDLNNGAVAVAGVKYTIIETRYEFVVTPAGSAFINEPGVTNVWVQNKCPFSLTDHAGMSYDKATWNIAMHALDPGHAISC